jgi:hypothetical protein
MARKRIGEILMQAGVLNENGLRSALVEQRRWGGQLGRILIEMKLVSEDVLVQALSHQMNFPVVNLEQVEFDPELLDLIPGELAEQHSIIPFKVEGNFLDVAMSDPTNLGIIDELRIRTRLNVRTYLAGPRAIEKAMGRFYGRGLGVISEPLGDRGPQSMSGAYRVRDQVDVLDLASDKRGPPAIPGTSSAEGRLPDSAAQRRAQAFSMAKNSAPVAATVEREAEILSLQERLAKLEALVTRDEDVLRKLLGLLVEKGIASREEILERIK